VSVVDHTKTSWFEKAESEIRTLKDVESVSIQGESDIIQEIHVLTRSNRPPKHIVRDIQSVMLNRFKRSIDYRVVSVAYLSAETTTAATDRGSGNGVASGPTSEPAAPLSSAMTSDSPGPPVERPVPLTSSGSPAMPVSSTAALASSAVAPTPMPSWAASISVAEGIEASGAVSSSASVGATAGPVVASSSSAAGVSASSSASVSASAAACSDWARVAKA